jgi:hypothetical protein
MTRLDLLGWLYCCRLSLCEEIRGPRSCGKSQHLPDAGRQLAQVEGLGDVVVGPPFEVDDLIALIDAAVSKMIGPDASLVKGWNTL